MADTKRHHGFVIGSDSTPGGQVVWKVRVRDPGSPYDGRKLIVASVYERLALARGLNVNFAIGTVDDNRSGKSLRAVDVRLDDPDSSVHSTGQTIRR